MFLRKKAMSLVEHTLIISLVVIAITTMSTYLRRSIQARLHDLTVSYISDGEPWQLATLNDFRTEDYERETNASITLSREEMEDGASSLNINSQFALNMEYTVDNVDRADYGDKANNVQHPPYAEVIWTP